MLPLENPLIANLPQPQRERLAARIATRRLAEGEILFHQDDPADAFYIVITGVIKLFRLSPDGGEKVVELINPGQSFAEALMFVGEKRYPVSAQAMADAQVAEIPGDLYLKLMRECPESCFTLLGDLSRRLHGLLMELDRVTLQRSRERLLTWLREEANKTVEGGDTVRLTVSKRVLAARLSFQPETLSRLLRTLKSEGVIREQGDAIILLRDDDPF
ncbi:Crp/Fnr family transcriptional regulator [Magnetofaba australis]|uniref:Putative Crp/FNR family transcriptional regulator n=1 Tax=Magnetofaba australis IT-1 TaxID=1434232 RepID=A0A1Y2K0C8_9PROT|nr:Crp/Fnr family transcriptional regulator [Magnetofaba australis]OSM00254.1 putative Crp/FNR family transcriptional regulator [Magnetofaba australis IT-1]